MSPGGRGRVARVRAHRRGAGADLLRLRGAGDRCAARGLRGEGRDLRRLVATGAASAIDDAARSLEEAAREARDRARRGAGTAAGRELVTTQPGTLAPLEVDAEHPYLLAYTSGTTGRPKGALHVHGGFLVSIAREVAYQADVNARRPRLLRDRHGLDHGAVDRRRRRRGRRDRRSTRRARRTGPHDRLWRTVESGARDDARRLADADPRADPEGRADAGPLVAAGDLHDRRAVEPGSVPLAVRARSAAAACRSSTSRAAPRSARASSRPCIVEPIKPVALGFPALGEDMDVVDADGTLGARRGRRARVPAAVAGDDARHVARSRAVPRHVLAALSRRVDARRLGVGRRGRLLVPARPQRRHAEHRGQADRPRRARVRGDRRPGSSRRRRPSASRTR